VEKPTWISWSLYLERDLETENKGRHPGGGDCRKSQNARNVIPAKAGISSTGLSEQMECLRDSGFRRNDGCLQIRFQSKSTVSKAGIQAFSCADSNQPQDPGLPDCRKTQTGVTVAPAKAGAQWFKRSFHHWIPAFAGMTTLMLRFQIVFDRKSTVSFAGMIHTRG
jgi:hypothetical protein